MKETRAIALILAVGIGTSLALRNYVGIALAALAIPAYLAYGAREQNILAKSRLYDRDLFVMIAIAVVVIITFDRFIDPRVGLIAMALAIPLLAIYADRLKGGKKLQKA